MKILAIETSCDETAITIMEASGDLRNASLVVLGNALYSQAKKHAAFGGVYPSLAKREHAANLVPLCELALKEAGMYERTSAALTPEGTHFVEEVLVREPGLGAACVRMLGSVARPDIDAIAVTQGPGLEPALWVGINFARALAHAWELPIIPVNHLEGHMLASVVSGAGTTDQPFVLDDVPFPLLGLILSGGHTEFVFAEAWGAYEIIGSTRDDSIGEAFDKVARLLGLPYPGGPEISRVAARARPSMYKGEVLPGVQLSPLPRPMIHSVISISRSQV
jgi:Metal-dependent proteases with possible chaperone activity